MTPLKPSRARRDAILLAAALPIAWFASIVAAPAEWALYDLRLELRRDGGWPADLVTVPLDENAIAALGGWPLPAKSIGTLVDAIQAAGAKTIVLDVFLGVAGSPEEQTALAPSLAHTVTALTFDPADGRPPTEDELRRVLVRASAGPEVAVETLSFPPPAIAAAVARLGHSGFVGQGPVRSSPPLVRVRGFDGAIPSQPLAALIQHRGLDPATVRLVRGETLLDLVPGGAPPRVVAAADLLAGATGSLSGALVVVHVDTPEDRHPSPLGPATPGGWLLAAAIRTLDGGRSPRVFPILPALLICASGSFLVIRIREKRARLLAWAALDATWIAAALGLVPAADVFLPVIGPLLVFACLYATIALSDSASATGDRDAPS